MTKSRDKRKYGGREMGSKWVTKAMCHYLCWFNHPSSSSPSLTPLKKTLEGVKYQTYDSQKKILNHTRYQRYIELPCGSKRLQRDCKVGWGILIHLTSIYRHRPPQLPVGSHLATQLQQLPEDDTLYTLWWSPSPCPKQNNAMRVPMLWIL